MTLLGAVVPTRRRKACHMQNLLEQPYSIARGGNMSDPEIVRSGDKGENTKLRKKSRPRIFLVQGLSQLIHANSVSTPSEAADPTGSVPSAGSHNHHSRRRRKSPGRPSP